LDFPLRMGGHEDTGLPIWKLEPND
jgi:hypothetical protein